MKKAQVPMNLLIGFVLAFVLLSVVFILVEVMIVMPRFSGVNLGLDVTLNATSVSRVCDHDLINFLRTTDETSGLEFAQLLAIDSPKFKTSAESYFENYFKRGDETRQGWRFIVMGKTTSPLVTIGTLDRMPIKTSCTQHVPGVNPGEYYVVKLGMEY